MYQIPNIGYIKVEWEPGFDPVKADEFVNPVLPTGYRLSSYTMLIEDYNTSRENILIVRKQAANRIKMHVESGDETHPLLRQTTNVAGNNVTVVNGSDELTGYQVKFSSRADTAIVKDPTRLLKLVLRTLELVLQLFKYFSGVERLLWYSSKCLYVAVLDNQPNLQ